MRKFTAFTVMLGIMLFGCERRFTSPNRNKNKYESAAKRAAQQTDSSIYFPKQKPFITKMSTH